MKNFQEDPDTTKDTETQIFGFVRSVVAISPANVSG